MAFERQWAAVPPQLLTSDGTQFGLITVADTNGFRVKQAVSLKNPVDVLQIPLQVKRVLSSTQMIVGPIDNKISAQNFSNVSAYTVAGFSTIEAGEQSKNAIPDKDHYEAIYEGDPVVADRVIQVDEHGNFYNSDNPMPIAFDGTVTVGNVEVVGPNGDPLKPNPDGSINVNIVSSPTGNTVVSKFNEVTSVASGSVTTLVTYIVPPATKSVLQRISVSGENIAKYSVLINAQPFETKRTNFGTELNVDFNYTTGNTEGFTLPAGATITVQVVHDRPYVADFEARLQVLEIEM